MRVLIVHSYDLIGSGSSIYTRNLTRALLDQGIDVTVLRFRSGRDEAAVDELRRRGAKVRDIPTWAASITYPRDELPDVPIVLALSYKAIEKRVEAIREEIEQAAGDRPFDRIFSNHLLIGSTAAVEYGARHHVPVTVISHGTDVEYVAAKDEVWAERAAEITAKAHRVIALNDRAQSRLSEVLGAPTYAFDITPPGIDTQSFKPLLDDRHPVFSVVGRLTLDKGQQLAIGALPFIMQKVPQAQLVLVGDGPERKHLENLVDILDRGDALGLARLSRGDPDRIARHAPLVRAYLGKEGREAWAYAQGHIKRRIHFTGLVSPSEVAGWLNQARVAVLPSMIQECYPLSLLEAMACGCRLIATERGAPNTLWRMAEHMHPGISKSAVAAECPKSIAQCVLHHMDQWSPSPATTTAYKIRETMGWEGISQSLLHGTPFEDQSWNREISNSRMSSWQPKELTPLSGEA